VQNFPRLTQLLGKSVDALDDEAIRTAVQNQVSEAVDLDWKSAHYKTTEKDRFELAKDVAQLANTNGGIIVLGVADVKGNASAATPVELGDHHHRRMNQVLSNWIQPFLVGVRYVPIQSVPGKGFLVIVVPQSLGAPHAVLRRDVDLPIALVYPVRDSTNTRWLSEYEIAVRYRDRYQSRGATEQRLGKVHAEGISRIQLHVAPWLTVSLVPIIAGSRGVGSEALEAEKQFLASWRTRYGCPETSPFWSTPRVLPGIRRAIITDMIEYSGSSRYPHSELHYGGAGFAATNGTFFTPGDGRSAVDDIAQDAMEMQIMFAVLLLAHHAADTGSSGECYVRAQQMLRQQTDPNETITPALIYEPVDRFNRGASTNYEKVDFSVRIERRQTLPADSSASLDELVSDMHAVVRISYALAADILGEFAVAEPKVLRSDGFLDMRRLDAQRRARIEPWAQRHGLIDMNP
jgi:hypothetical protein